MELVSISDVVTVLTNNGVHFCDIVKITSDLKAFPPIHDSVLDKIKAEISVLSDSKCNGNSVIIYSWSGMQKRIFEIIDRYKAESEV